MIKKRGVKDVRCVLYCTLAPWTVDHNNKKGSRDLTRRRQCFWVSFSHHFPRIINHHRVDKVARTKETLFVDIITRHLVRTIYKSVV